ncbi:MAG: hypothetical protein ACFFD4_07875 [Candidatus Odinarchaeota archaeon]
MSSEIKIGYDGSQQVCMFCDTCEYTPHCKDVDKRLKILEQLYKHRFGLDPSREHCLSVLLTSQDDYQKIGARRLLNIYERRN